MALIIYPLPDANSFVTIAEADSIISSITANDNGWSLLDDPAKEAQLTQSFFLITSCNSFKPPDTAEQGLKQAQSLYSMYNVDKDLYAFDANEKAITEEKVGSLQVKYDAALKADGSIVYPPFVAALLRPYGCRSTNGSTRQSYLGRS